MLNAAIVGFSFLFVKLALHHAGTLDTLAYRFAVSFVVMTIPVLFGKIRLNFRSYPFYRILLLATFYPVGFFAFQTFGLQRSTSSEGGILFALTPVLTMILASVYLKETTTVLQKLSIFISVIGTVFIYAMKGTGLNLSNTLGIFLLFLSCLALAGYNVMARSLLRTYRPAEISYLMLGIGFITFLVGSLVDHAADGTLTHFIEPLSSYTFILSILYLGVMSSLVTALTANYALSKIEASKMSVFTNLSTIVSIAAGAIVLGEPVTTHHLIGSALIIAGVMGTNRFERSKEELKVKCQP